jgi:hydrogenase maturation protease
MPDAETNPEGTVHTLVLGVGNVLLTDEGAGVHVVRHLLEAYPQLPGVTCLDGGTLSFTLAGDIEAADQLVVVDAAELRAAPGTIRTFENEAMDRFLGTAKMSVHEVGLLDLMDVARLSGHLPARRLLVGIQPQVFDWGEAPSPEVAAVIPEAARIVHEHILSWLNKSVDHAG